MLSISSSQVPVDGIAWCSPSYLSKSYGWGSSKPIYIFGTGTVSASHSRMPPQSWRKKKKKKEFSGCSLSVSKVGAPNRSVFVSSCYRRTKGDSLSYRSTVQTSELKFFFHLRYSTPGLYQQGPARVSTSGSRVPFAHSPACREGRNIRTFSLKDNSPSCTCNVTGGQ